MKTRIQRGKTLNYVFNLQRNYGYEVAEYIQLKRELLKRKNMLLKGEITAEELKQ